MKGTILKLIKHRRGCSL